MRLILLRHGETLWNQEHRLQGHQNSPLSEKGIQQAKAIKPLIEQFSPKYVVSSDLGRALQTAEIIGCTNPTQDSELRELAMGEWEGCKSKRLWRKIQGYIRLGVMVIILRKAAKAGKHSVSVFHRRY